MAGNNLAIQSADDTGAELMPRGVALLHTQFSQGDLITEKSFDVALLSAQIDAFINEVILPKIMSGDKGPWDLDLFLSDAPQTGEKLYKDRRKRVAFLAGNSRSPFASSKMIKVKGQILREEVDERDLTIYHGYYRVSNAFDSTVSQVILELIQAKLGHHGVPVTKTDAVDRGLDAKVVTFKIGEGEVVQVSPAPERKTPQSQAATIGTRVAAILPAGLQRLIGTK